MLDLKQLVAGVLLALGLACSSNDAPDAATDAAFEAPGDVRDEGSAPPLAFCEGPVEAVFAPANGLALPFPSDRFTTADPTTPTGRRVAFTPDNSAAEPMFTLYPYLQA